MDLIEIEKLLIKYENAETTLNEEAILRTYFLTEKVPSHLKEYQKKNEALKSLAQITEGLKLVSANLNKGNQSFKKLFVFENTLYKVTNININN